MRIAAIQYINTLPLIFGLQHRHDHDLILDTPSACFRKLIANEVDVALIPVLGTQMHTEVCAIPDLGIASENQTESVFVYSKKPLSKIQTVAVDPASLTSVNLLKIILHQQYQNQPEFVTIDSAEIHDRLKSCDAALVIGDAAIITNVPGMNRWDLASEWHAMTQLPFIFAVWASLRRLTSSEQEVFQQSYLEGQASQEIVINQACKMLPVDREFVKRYYNLDLHYQLTPNDYQGFSRYLALAADLKFVDNIRTDIWM
jgi:chorismate dehydratase